MWPWLREEGQLMGSIYIAVPVKSIYNGWTDEKT